MAHEPGSFPSNLVAFPGPHESSRDLPLGVWRMMANGRLFQLEIRGVSGSEVDGRLTSGQFVNGTWNASAGKLTFTRVTTIKQEYRGYLLHFDPSDPLWRLAGVFGDITVGEQAGWYATLPRE